MARVIAVHSIHKVITPGKAKTATEKAVPPKVEVIKPEDVEKAKAEAEKKAKKP